MSIQTHSWMLEKKKDPTKWSEVEWGDVYNYLIQTQYYFIYFCV